MRVALYARISEDRDGEAVKVSDQLKDGRALAVGRGWEVAAEYSDNDISALKGKHRPGYDALMAAADARQFDRIVVWHTSRLWRNRRERAEGIERLKTAEVGVVAVKGPELDMSTAYGRGMAGLIGEFDTMESEVKSERVARAALRRAEQGGNHGGGRAFGYTGSGLELIPAEAREIAWMYDQLLIGVPLASITRDLNNRGVPTVKGGPWSPASVRTILYRARNCSLSEYRGEVVGEGTWPAIVTETVWRAAVALLNDPSRRTSTGNRASYLLSGIATCAAPMPEIGPDAICGASIMSAGSKRSSKTLARRRIYKCRAFSHVGRRQDWCDQYVAAKVIERLSRPDARALLVDDERPDIEALRNEAHALRIRLDGAAVAFAEGVTTARQMRIATERIRARLSEVEAAQAHPGRALVLAELIEADDVAAAWERLTLDRQRAVVRVLVDVRLHPGGGGRATFDPSKVQVIWKC